MDSNLYSDGTVMAMVVIGTSIAAIVWEFPKKIRKVLENRRNADGERNTRLQVSRPRPGVLVVSQRMTKKKSLTKTT